MTRENIVFDRFLSSEGHWMNDLPGLFFRKKAYQIHIKGFKVVAIRLQF